MSRSFTRNGQPSKQPNRSAVLRLESRRAECVALLHEITGGDDCQPAAYEIRGHWHRSGVSRARGGQSCPVHRVVVLLEALRQAGRPREDAERVLVYCAGVIDQLWPLSDIDYDAAHDREAGSDADEDYFQRKLSRMMPHATVADLRLYRDALGRQLADGKVLYAMTERLIEERECEPRRWRAKSAKGWMSA